MLGVKIILIDSLTERQNIPAEYICRTFSSLVFCRICAASKLDALFFFFFYHVRATGRTWFKVTTLLGEELKLSLYLHLHLTQKT